MFYTYSIKNIENGKFYIGSRTAKCMLNRKPEDDLGVKYFSSSKDKELRQAIKDGKVKYTILKEYDDPEVCWRAEQQLIALYWKFFGKDMSYNHFYRTCFGKNIFSTIGIDVLDKMTEEEKIIKSKKSSIAMKKKWAEPGYKESMKSKHNGQVPTFLGHHHTQESKDKISKTLKGENNPMYGKSPSEETRKKMSEAKKGYIPWNKGTKGLQKAWNKGKSLQKYYFKTPNGEIKIMAKSHAKQYHPDWTLIAQVEE